MITCYAPTLPTLRILPEDYAEQKDGTIPIGFCQDVHVWGRAVGNSQDRVFGDVHFCCVDISESEHKQMKHRLQKSSVLKSGCCAADI